MPDETASKGGIDGADDRQEVIVRRATIGELPQLRAQLLRENRYAGDLQETIDPTTNELRPPTSIVFVIEHGGIVSGAYIARPLFEGELILYSNFKRDAPPSAIRRAIFRLATAMKSWIGSKENDSPCRSLISNIEDVAFGELAKDFGMLQVYKKGIVVGFDTERHPIGIEP